jgi:hypothetical protein
MSEPGKIPLGKLAFGLALCLVGVTCLGLAVNATFQSVDLANPHGAPAGSGPVYAVAAILIGVGIHLVRGAIRRK